jgi:hypothetical protein
LFTSGESTVNITSESFKRIILGENAGCITQDELVFSIFFKLKKKFRNIFIVSIVFIITINLSGGHSKNFNCTFFCNLKRNHVIDFFSCSQFIFFLVLRPPSFQKIFSQINAYYDPHRGAPERKNVSYFWNRLNHPLDPLWYIYYFLENDNLWFQSVLFCCNKQKRYVFFFTASLCIFRLLPSK